MKTKNNRLQPILRRAAVTLGLTLWVSGATAMATEEAWVQTATPVETQRETRLVSMYPHPALAYDGLWRDGRPAEFFRLIYSSDDSLCPALLDAYNEPNLAVMETSDGEYPAVRNLVESRLSVVWAQRSYNFETRTDGSRILTNRWDWIAIDLDGDGGNEDVYRSDPSARLYLARSIYILSRDRDFHSRSDGDGDNSRAYPALEDHRSREILLSAPFKGLASDELRISLTESVSAELWERARAIYPAHGLWPDKANTSDSFAYDIAIIEDKPVLMILSREKSLFAARYNSDKSLGILCHFGPAISLAERAFELTGGLHGEAPGSEAVFTDQGLVEMPVLLRMEFNRSIFRRERSKIAPWFRLDYSTWHSVCRATLNALNKPPPTKAETSIRNDEWIDTDLNIAWEWRSSLGGHPAGVFEQRWAWTLADIDHDGKLEDIYARDGFTNHTTSTVLNVVPNEPSDHVPRSTPSEEFGRFKPVSIERGKEISFEYYYATLAKGLDPFLPQFAPEYHRLYKLAWNNENLLVGFKDILRLPEGDFFIIRSAHDSYPAKIAVMHYLRPNSPRIDCLLSVVVPTKEDLNAN